MYYSGSNSTRQIAKYFYIFRVYGGGSALQPLQAARQEGKEPAYPNVEDEETWETWKNITTSNMDQDMMDEIASNFAHFMNCNLN